MQDFIISISNILDKYLKQSITNKITEYYCSYVLEKLIKKLIKKYCCTNIKYLNYPRLFMDILIKIDYFDKNLENTYDNKEKLLLDLYNIDKNDDYFILHIITGVRIELDDMYDIFTKNGAIWEIIHPDIIRDLYYYFKKKYKIK